MGDLVHALGIDWPALIAQMVNFAIVLVILTKFVYKPVLKILDERRDLVADSVKKMDEINSQKERMDNERTVILRKADEEAGILLSTAKGDIETMRAEIERGARLQAEQIIAKGREQLQMERAKLVKEMQDKLAHAIVLSAEKILRREFSKEDQASFEDELKQNLPNLMN